MRKHISLWVIFGVFDRKKIILSQKLVKITAEKKPKSGKPRQAHLGAHLSYKLQLVAPSSSQMHTEMMVLGHRMGFLTKNSGFWPL